ncbi:hypothetical protein LPJ64_000594 [Coemansia asiatica]|uniref:MYND-type domain-containing protein n=1 Tax=Coemansia asiatica TaxID=1052880 RepID=A0A9W7XMQ6_9FUNG|nr:hypothetical protein LPJ64_000594 [Coemansia asiatica]
MTITLGYAEPLDEDFHTEPFPSKIGGKPQWLDPRHPLPVDRVRCDECSKAMSLLMQLYAPEDTPETAFHRMLYVFMCRNGACHRGSANRCMRVFRKQMAEENPVYQEERDGEEDVVWVLNEQVQGSPACVVCGLAGTKACSKCHVRRYCSREHQLADWEMGHRAQCSKGLVEPTAAHQKKLQRMVYPELVIVSEEEDEQATAMEQSDDEGSDDEEIKAGDMALVPVTNEKAEDSQVEVDKAFLVFQRRIQSNPDQVLRYARAADSAEEREPLFVSDEGRPVIDDNVPDCERCGAKREFEMQIMPQMLNYLSIDSTDPTSIDWGTLLVYTCANSCDLDSDDDAEYAREVVCRQNFSSQGIGEKFVRAMHGDDSGITRQIESLTI